MFPIVTIKRPPAPPPPTVVLELDETTAGVLLVVLGNIGGSHTGPRGDTSRIYNALLFAGVRSAPVAVTGSLYLLS